MEPRDDEIVHVMGEDGKVQTCYRGALAYARGMGLRPVVWVIHPTDAPVPLPIYEAGLDAAVSRGYRQVNPPSTITAVHRTINQPRPETNATFPDASRAPQVEQLPQDAVPFGVGEPVESRVMAPEVDQLPQDSAPAGHARLRDQLEADTDPPVTTTRRRRGRPPKLRPDPLDAESGDASVIGPDGVKSTRNRGI
jgi:hypothetical protein